MKRFYFKGIMMFTRKKFSQHVIRRTIMAFFASYIPMLAYANIDGNVKPFKFAVIADPQG